MARGELGDLGDRALRRHPVARLAGQRSQPEEDRGGHRVARGHGVVLDVLWTGKQDLVVVGGVEEAAGWIAEAGQDRVGQGPGDAEPALVERRAVQGQQPLGQAGVVLEDPTAGGAAVLPAAAQVPARLPAAVGQQVIDAGRGGPERGCPVAPGPLGVARLPGSGKRDCGLGKGGNRQAIPAGQDLVVPGGLRPAVALGEEGQPAALEPPAKLILAQAEGVRQGRVRLDPVQDRTAIALGPVALVGHVPGPLDQAALVAQAGCLERRLDLPGRPGEGRPFDAVGVGIATRGEAPVGRREVPDDRIERRHGNRPVARLAQELPGMQVGPGRAGRCRRASARSGAPARGRRSSSGGSRPRAGRAGRLRPSRRGSSRSIR